MGNAEDAAGIAEHGVGTAEYAAAGAQNALAVVEHERKVSSSTRRALREALATAGTEPASWVRVPKARRAKDAVAEVVQNGAKTVVVCGGDGTVRAAAEALVDTQVALAVLPTGTANAFARGLDLPAEPAALVELIKSGRRRVIDTGVCNDLTFTVMAGAGFDAAMIDETDSAAKAHSKSRLGVLSYFRAGLLQARRREPFQATVFVDDVPFFEGPSTSLLVGNLGTLRGGLRAFPAASPTDGLLDVGVVTAAGLRQWASLLVRLIRQAPGNSAHAQLTQGSRIDVRLDGEHRFELDGGTKGTTDRLRFRIRPKSLVVCAPS